MTKKPYYTPFLKYIYFYKFFRNKAAANFFINFSQSQTSRDSSQNEEPTPKTNFIYLSAKVSIKETAANASNTKAY